MTPTFLTIARQGRNGWKRYLLGILLCLGAPFGTPLMILMPIIIISASISGIAIQNTDLLVYGNPFRTVLFYGWVGVAFLLGLFLAVTRVHRRKFITLFGVDNSIDWLRIFQGFIVWLGLFGISFFVWYLIIPSRYSLTFNISEWLPFSLLVLVVTPVVVLPGTLFVYAYLLQAAGLLIKRPLLLSIVFGLIIGVSTNLKMPSDWIINVAAITFMAWIVIKDNRIELALGIAIASHLISMLFLGFPDDLIKAPTIFKADGIVYLLPSLITFVLKAGLFYFICFGRRRNLSASTID